MTFQCSNRLSIPCSIPKQVQRKGRARLFAAALSLCIAICSAGNGFGQSQSPQQPTASTQNPESSDSKKAVQIPGQQLPVPKRVESAEGGEPSSAAKPNAQMQAVLDVLGELGGKPIEELTPTQAREQPSIADAVAVLAKRQGKPTIPQALKQVEDLTVRGPGSELRLRVYTPQGNAPLPVLVYFHGGGWVLADIDAYDSSCRALANAASCIVVSCDYRHAPESPFPAAADDAFAAYRWVTENADKIGGDGQRIAIGGESAGGNLATVTARRATVEGLTKPVHQLLIYPVTNFDFETPSYREHANARPLNQEMMKWFWKQYLPNPEMGADPFASPLRAKNLKEMPPTTVITAEIDPLRSEANEYANALKQSSVPVNIKNFAGVTHEFFGMGLVLDSAKEAVEFAAAELKAAFAPDKPH